MPTITWWRRSFTSTGMFSASTSRADGGASLRPLLQKIGLNEEDFCEEFARFMNHRSYPGDTSGEAFESILKAFFALAFGQEEALAA